MAHFLLGGKLNASLAMKQFLHMKKIAQDDIYCYVGYDYENGLCETRKNDFDEIFHLKQTGDELYITTLDFSWTFVWTHEAMFGPYFMKK